MQKFKERKILFTVEGRNLIVSIFRIIKPYLSYSSFFLCEGIREVIKYIEVFAEISQLFIWFSPNQSIST